MEDFKFNWKNKSNSDDEFKFNWKNKDSDTEIDHILSSSLNDNDAYNKLRVLEKTGTSSDLRNKARLKADDMESGFIDSGLRGIAQGISRIGKGTVGIANTGIDLLNVAGDALGMDDINQISIRDYDEFNRDIAPSIDKDDYGKKLTNIIGQATPAMGLTAGAGMGALATGMSGLGATVLGSTIGGTFQGAEAKESALTDIPLSDPNRKSKAYKSGLTQAALESAGNLVPMGRLLNKLPISQSMTRKILTGMAEGAVGEGIEEYLQGIAKPYIESGKISEKDYADAWESAKYGAATGAVFGGAFSKFNKPDTYGLPDGGIGRLDKLDNDYANRMKIIDRNNLEIDKLKRAKASITKQISDNLKNRESAVQLKETDYLDELELHKNVYDKSQNSITKQISDNLKNKENAIQLKETDYLDELELHKNVYDKSQSSITKQISDNLKNKENAIQLKETDYDLVKLKNLNDILKKRMKRIESNEYIQQQLEHVGTESAKRKEKLALEAKLEESKVLSDKLKQMSYMTDIKKKLRDKVKHVSTEDKINIEAKLEEAKVLSDKLKQMSYMTDIKKKLRDKVKFAGTESAKRKEKLVLESEKLESDFRKQKEQERTEYGISSGTLNRSMESQKDENWVNRFISDKIEVGSKKDLYEETKDMQYDWTDEDSLIDVLDLKRKELLDLSFQVGHSKDLLKNRIAKNRKMKEFNSKDKNLKFENKDSASRMAIFEKDLSSLNSNINEFKKIYRKYGTIEKMKDIETQKERERQQKEMDRVSERIASSQRSIDRAAAIKKWKEKIDKLSRSSKIENSSPSKWRNPITNRPRIKKHTPERISSEYRVGIGNLFGDDLRYTESELNEVPNRSFNQIRKDFSDEMAELGISAPIFDDGIILDEAEINEGVTLGTEAYIGNPSDIEAIIHESIHTILNNNEEYRDLSINNKESLVKEIVGHYLIEPNPEINEMMGEFGAPISKFVKGIAKQHKSGVPTTLGIDERSSEMGGYDPEIGLIDGVKSKYIDDTTKTKLIINKLTERGRDLSLEENDMINKRELEQDIFTIGRSDGMAEYQLKQSGLGDLIQTYKDKGLNDHQASEAILAIFDTKEGADPSKFWGMGSKTDINLSPVNKYGLETTSDTELVLDNISKDLKAMLIENGLIKEDSLNLKTDSSLLYRLLGTKLGTVNDSKTLVDSLLDEKTKLKSGDIDSPIVYIFDAMINVNKAITKNNFFKNFMTSVTDLKNKGVLTSDMFRKISPDSKTKNKISFFEDGKEQTYWISPGVKDAFDTMMFLNENNYIKTKSEVNNLAKFIIKSSAFFRNVIIKNPGFAVRNFIKDLQTQLFSSSGTIFTREDQTKAELSAMNIQNELESSGLLGKRTITSNKQEFYKSSIEKANEMLNNNDGFIIEEPGKLKKMLDFWEDLSERSETVGRINEYKRSYTFAREELGYTEQKSKDYALFATQDIMNFQRGGSDMRFIGSMIPFLNSNIQGLRKISKPIVTTLRKLKMGNVSTDLEGKELSSQLKNIGKATALVSSITLALKAIKEATNGDDLSDDILNKYWQISMGPGRNLMIPKGFEESFFSNIFRNAWDMNPEGAKKSATKLATGLIPSVETGLDKGKEIWDIAVNGLKTDWMTGKKFDINKKYDDSKEVIWDRGKEAVRSISGPWWNVAKNVIDIPMDFNKRDVPYTHPERIIRDVANIFGLRTADSRYNLKNISDLANIKKENVFTLKSLKNYNKRFSKYTKKFKRLKEKFYEDRSTENRNKLMAFTKKMNEFAGKFVTKFNKSKEKNIKKYKKNKER